jgi:hypothetical protein
MRVRVSADSHMHICMCMCMRMCLCMCMCVCAFTCACKCAYMCMRMCLCMCMCVCAYTFVHVNVHIHAHGPTGMCMYICICVCTGMCTAMCIDMHTAAHCPISRFRPPLSRPPLALQAPDQRRAGCHQTDQSQRLQRGQPGPGGSKPDVAAAARTPRGAEASLHQPARPGPLSGARWRGRWSG